MEFRRIIIYTGLAFCFLGLNTSLFGQGDVISQVKSALNTGSSKELVKYLDKTSDIDIEGEKASYSKTQAEVILKDFFRSYPPTNFQIIHQGASKAGSPYVIGQYSYNLLNLEEREQVISIAQSRPIPSHCVVVRKDLHQPTVVKIQETLMSLNNESNRHLLKYLYSVDGYIKVDHSDYNSVEQMAKEFGYLK